MSEEQNREETDGPRPDESPVGDAPGGLSWPFRRLYWSLEKYVLWPVADSFRRLSNSFRYRSPAAYIGATAMVMVTIGAVGAAVYFYNQAGDPEAPVTAQAPIEPETVIAPAPQPVVNNNAAPSNGNDDNTLKGVVPNFKASGKNGGKNKSDGSSGSGDSSGGNGNTSGGSGNLPGNVVRPAGEPSSPPLKVAHKFAATFVEYEVGKKGAAQKFRQTATGKLSRQLRQSPPRQPSNGRIPQATVMNVVKGKQSGKNMDVSVSLMRSGTTSELRLALTQQDGEQWLVSEVRG